MRSSSRPRMSPAVVAGRMLTDTVGYVIDPFDSNAVWPLIEIADSVGRRLPGEKRYQRVGTVKIPIVRSRTTTPTNHGQRRRRRGGSAGDPGASGSTTSSDGGAGTLGSVMSVTLLVALGVVVLSAV